MRPPTSPIHAGSRRRSASALRPGWVLGTVAVLMLATTLVTEAGSSTGRRVLLFDPDANHQAIISIAGLFNGFLAEVDPTLKLQPVQSRDSFEKLLEEEETAFAIIPSGYVRSGSPARLTPLAVPAKGNDPYYTKLLVDRGQGVAGDLRGKTVAVTDSKRGSLSGLEHSGLSMANVVTVPVSKDIDGLLALTFGQVDAALVTPGSLEVLKRINPKAAASMRVVRETAKILRSPLCAVEGRSEAGERRALLAALAHMGESESGKRALQVMGFDGWVPFEARMLERP